jgi:putative ABC transport system ATP-binding protein
MSISTIDAAVRAEQISKRYRQGPEPIAALDQVSVAFEAGRFTAVLGPSGSGKSTLLHCLAGLETVDSGSVFLGEIELTGLGERQLTHLRRDRVGFVFQSFNLIPTLDAIDNITLPARIAGRRIDGAWIDQLVGTLGLGDRLRHRPAQLSGGQQQRVAAARALAGRPTVVIADEPTGNLDSRSGAELLGVLRASVDELGQTIVMVTHDPVAASHADRAVFLADGRVVDDIEHPTTSGVLEHIGIVGG